MKKRAAKKPAPKRTPKKRASKKPVPAPKKPAAKKRAPKKPAPKKPARKSKRPRAKKAVTEKPARLTARPAREAAELRSAAAPRARSSVVAKTWEMLPPGSVRPILIVGGIVTAFLMTRKTPSAAPAPTTPAPTPRAPTQIEEVVVTPAADITVGEPIEDWSADRRTLNSLSGYHRAKQSEVNREMVALAPSYLKYPFGSVHYVRAGGKDYAAAIEAHTNHPEMGPTNKGVSIFVKDTALT